MHSVYYITIQTANRHYSYTLLITEQANHVSVKVQDFIIENYLVL